MELEIKIILCKEPAAHGSAVPKLHSPVSTEHFKNNNVIISEKKKLDNAT